MLSGLVGAAEALARDMQDGALTRDEAVGALASIMRATLRAVPR